MVWGQAVGRFQSGRLDAALITNQSGGSRVAVLPPARAAGECNLEDTRYVGLAISLFLFIFSSLHLTVPDTLCAVFLDDERNTHSRMRNTHIH